MRNITGPPVDGADFFGREEELARLQRAVEAGNHVLLLGPRRVGKSSIVSEISRLLRADGWVVVTLDVQQVADEAAFLHELLESIKASEIDLPLLTQVEGMVTRFRQFFRGTTFKGGGIEIELGDSPADWDTTAGSLRKLIPTLSGSNRRVLIAIDELPVFLSKLLAEPDGVERVRQILDWLRSVRQACGTSLPWILCGSIGLDSFVDRHGLAGTINELQPQTVGSFNTDTAIQCLQRLADTGSYAFQLSEDLAREIIHRVGWPIPFYLQLMFHALAELPQSQRSETYPSVDDIEAAYQSLLDPHQRVHFAHWDSRLGDLLDTQEQARTRLLLRHLSGLAEGSVFTTLFNVLAADYPQADTRALDRELRDLLDFLERDGYLMRSGDQFAFRSFLLRDYWKQRFA